MAENDLGDNMCERCDALMEIRSGDDPTPLCDHCAQEIASEVWDAREPAEEAFEGALDGSAEVARRTVQRLIDAAFEMQGAYETDPYPVEEHSAYAHLLEAVRRLQRLDRSEPPGHLHIVVRVPW